MLNVVLQTAVRKKNVFSQLNEKIYNCFQLIYDFDINRDIVLESIFSFPTELGCSNSWAVFQKSKIVKLQI